MRPAKRVFDLTASAFGLVVLAPVLAGIALLVRLGGRGPVFFRQERIGRGGRPFRIWKFRTMVADAERLGAQITVGKDARITRVGALLRRAKLDELPQLLNVLAGEMSLVGPRPEVPRYVELYTPDQRRVLELTPGITDVASIAFWNEGELLAAARDPDQFYREVIMPEKIRLNLDYSLRASLGTDILVILNTLGIGRPAARTSLPEPGGPTTTSE